MDHDKKNLNILFPCSGYCDTEFRYIEHLLKEKPDIHIDTIILMDQIYNNNMALCDGIKLKAPKDIKIIFTNSFYDMFAIVEKFKIDLIVSFGFQIAGAVDTNNLRLTHQRHWDIVQCLYKLGVLLKDTEWLQFPYVDYDFVKPINSTGKHFTVSADEILQKIPAYFVHEKIGIK